MRESRFKNLGITGCHIQWLACLTGWHNCLCPTHHIIAVRHNWDFELVGKVSAVESISREREVQYKEWFARPFLQTYG